LNVYTIRGRYEKKSLNAAKIFKNGQSQAVRLPKEFRFDTDEVFISKEGDKVILFPKRKMTWEGFFERHEPCPEFNIDRSDNIPPRERDLF
jgi:antitoxin VapB